MRFMHSVTKCSWVRKWVTRLTGGIGQQHGDVSLALLAQPCCTVTGHIRALREVSSSGLVTSGPLASECTSTSIFPKSRSTAAATSVIVKPCPEAAAYRLLVRICTRPSRTVRRTTCMELKRRLPIPEHDHYVGS